MSSLEETCPMESELAMKSNPQRFTSCKNAKLLLFLLSSLTGFTSCATKPAETKTTAGNSTLTATAPKGHEANRWRITIVSINQKSVRSKTSPLRSGSNTVAAKLRWQDGKTATATLRFHALENRSYFVKCSSPSPPRYPIESTRKYGGSRLAPKFLEVAEPLGGYLGLPFVAGGVAVGLVEGLGRTTHATIANASKSPLRGDYADLLIVSEDPREGVVASARVHKNE